MNKLDASHQVNNHTNLQRSMLVKAQHLNFALLPPRPFLPKNYPEDTFRKMGVAKGCIVGVGVVFLFKIRDDLQIIRDHLGIHVGFMFDELKGVPAKHGGLGGPQAH